MGPLTLLEASKTFTNDDPGIFKRGIYETFARSSGILENLPIEGISGNAISFSREERLPTSTFRPVNGSYKQTYGVTDNVVDTLAICGGEVDIDEFIEDTQGTGKRAYHVSQTVKSMGLGYESAFFKGSKAHSPEVFDGLQVRVNGNQHLNVAKVLDKTPSAGGDPLSLFALEAAMEQTNELTHILMNTRLFLRLSASTRDSNVSGNINFSINQYGEQIATFQGIPIVKIKNNYDDVPNLGFDEPSLGGGALSTSVYCVSFKPSGVVGIQNGGIRVRFLGQVDEKPCFRTRMSWYCGMSIKNVKSVTRLSGVKDAPIVA